MKHMFSKAFSIYAQKQWAEKAALWLAAGDAKFTGSSYILWFQRLAGAEPTRPEAVSRQWLSTAGYQQDPPGPEWCSSAGDSSSRTYHWTRWNITRTALQSKSSAPSFPLHLRGQTGISIWQLSQMEEPPCLAASTFSLTGISPSTSHTSVPTLASTSHRTQTNKMCNSKYLDQCKWVTIIPYEICTFRSM